MNKTELNVATRMNFRNIIMRRKNYIQKDTFYIKFESMYNYAFYYTWREWEGT